MRCTWRIDWRVGSRIASIRTDIVVVDGLSESWMEVVRDCQDEHIKTRRNHIRIISMSIADKKSVCRMDPSTVMYEHDLESSIGLQHRQSISIIGYLERATM